jgi:site-specific recombinase XerD
VRILGLTNMNNDTPLSDAIEAYARSLEAAGKAEKTILWYVANLLRFTEWLQVGGLTGVLGDLRIEIAEEYLAQRRRDGKAAATRRGDAMSLKAFSTWLARKRSYPVKGSSSTLRDLDGGPSRDKDTRDQEPLSDQELEVLLGRYEPESFVGLRDGAFIRLMVDCGCRLTEALTARTKDIAWPHNELVISGKTGTRSVKFSEETGRWLELYERERQNIVRPDVQTLIVTDDGSPLTESGAHSLFARLKRVSGNRRLHPHLLRHTWATNYRRFGCGDLLDLQQRGGWRDLAMVRRYAHIRPEAERQREQAPLDRMRASNTPERVANQHLQTKLSKMLKNAKKHAA